MHTVVETPGYLRDAEGLFSEEERAAIIEMVAADPECGDLIPGTGGFRKVRVARRGGVSAAVLGSFISCAMRVSPCFSLPLTPRTRKQI